MSTAIVGTGPLLRPSLKHDGRNFAPWVVIATALSASSIIAYPLVFPTALDQAGLAALVGSNPALGLIFGPAYDVTTADGFNAWRSLALGGLLAALGAIFAVTSATRGQEDSGQAELLASGVMGRASRLLTATGMGLIGSVLIGLVAGLVTWAVGGDPESSMLLGATFTATGWMMTAVAAVTSQLGTDARTASSMAVGTFGVLFILRGFTYSIDAPEWANWINPLSWMIETRPATGNVWWPLSLAIAFTAIGLIVAFVLQARRDFGQGAIAPSPGPARGRIRSTWHLAFSLNKGPILTWTVGFAILGVVFGYFTTAITDILSSDSTVQQVLAAGAASPDELYGAFVETILSLIGIIASISGVQMVLKVRKEEMEDRVEPIVATATARARYYGSNVLMALLSVTWFVLVAGVLIAAFASSADIGVSFGDAFAQAALTVPAVWTVVAVAVAVVGARPVVALAAWLGVLISFVLTLLGPTFGLPDWMLDISPFRHIPAVAAGDPEWGGLLAITAVTLLLVGIGFGGFRRRDLATT